jgi:phage tail sheath protein FI
MTSYMTPGVYIEEKNAFPGSAVAVETAVPVFIGYTEMAERKGISLIGDPIRVSSFAEYVQWFGHGYHHKFGLSNTADSPPSSPPAAITKFNSDMVTKPTEMFYFYNSIRLFYQNGGSNCYIMSIGTYGEGGNKKTAVDVADLPDALFTKLEKTFEPTMVVIPDFVTKRDDCYDLYVKVLRHCEKTQSRFGIFDVIPAEEDASMEDTFLKFRDGIGSEALKYGAAYYPWVNTSIVLAAELNFTNLDVTPEQLKTILPEKDVTTVIDKWNEAKNKTASPPASPPVKAETPQEAKKRVEKENTTLHQSLLASSITYTQIMAEVRNKLNLLPPSAAMAGVYSLVDGTRGVWKAPANVSLSMVSSPAVNISSEEQEKMNIDAITGKSINAIRPFPGLGSLVWGARTLDGNSQDWRYINVRRTMIMIEQSLKLACRAYVFEPNDSSTWVTMKSMMNNFLNNLWKQGALAGAVPEQAFDVQVGLGATMTPTDILDGYLLVTVKLALVRPAEFIVLTFQQQQQQS